MVSDEEAAVPLEKAEAFLQQIFVSMHLEVTIEREKSEEAFILNMTGDDLGILIGKHGQTLDSLQYLTNLAANHGLTEKRIHIVLDVEHYRNRREETLRRLASRLADKALRTRQRIMLEPMNRHERKIIHMALQENRRVSTYSAGDEPYRKVVIEPVKGRGGYRDRYHDRREAAADRPAATVEE
ncbi:MAG: KH domain-containing protein [Synergistaceae bacterium]|nr:KH domain-containing protein [Synergistaceae bacterium]